MNQECDDLEQELHKHEEKSLKLFREAESLHERALKLPYARRGEAMSNAIAKQREALEEIHITADIQHQVDSGQCEETLNQPPELQGEDKS